VQSVIKKLDMCMWMVVITLMVRVRSESLAQGGVMGMTFDVDLNRGLSYGECVGA
jgi:hypothetical protein